MKCPPGGPEAVKQYHKFKKFDSIILFVLVDPKYRFIWASAGAPDNTHDSTLFQSIMRTYNGRKYPPSISFRNRKSSHSTVDSWGWAFAVRTWIIKPYGHAILNEQKCYINYRLTRARMVTEGAFGKLKGRWKVLSKKCESNPQLSKGLA